MRTFLRAVLTCAVVLSPALARAQSGPAIVPTADSTTPAAAPSIDISETDGRPRGFIPQNALAGAVGLLRMSSAETGMVGQLRLGLHGEYFTRTKFLFESDNMRDGGDVNTRLQGALTFGVTPVRYLEFFGAVLGSANKNRRCMSSQAGTCVSEGGRTDPEVMKALGDVILGTKLAYPLPNGLSVGGELGLRLLSSVSGISFDADSTSVWFGGLATWNMQEAAKIPLRAHLNVGMYFDNSYNVQSFGKDITLPSRLASGFAYGMAKDRFRTSVGLDAPLAQIANGLSLRPMIEYHFEYITGSADKAFEAVTSPPNCGGAGQDECRTNKDQMWFTLGAQAQVLHGLTLTAGLDIAVRSVGFAYGPPLAPWNLIFGVSYPLDLVPRVITKQVAVEKIVVAKPTDGFVAGKVVSAAGTPIEGAIIAVAGHVNARVLSDADGTFRSVPLAPGAVELVITASGYESASVNSVVVAGQTATVSVTLTPRPPAARVAGRVSDETGKGVAATVKLAGPQIAEGKADESGAFTVAVQPGKYVMRVEAEQYLSKEIEISVGEGETPAAVMLHTRPAVAGLVYKDGKLTLRQPITFKSAGKKQGAELTAGMPILLDEVIDVLVSHPEIRQVRIEAHTDNSLPAAKAQALTEQQAKAVADYLVKEGIPQSRLMPAGIGSAKPVAPNLGKGKAKNRRVELVAVP